MKLLEIQPQVLFYFISLLGEADVVQAFESDKENAQKYFGNKEKITLEIFPEFSRLCQLFPLVEFKFQNLPSIVYFKILIFQI